MIVRTENGYSITLCVPEGYDDIYSEIIERIRDYDRPSVVYNWNFDNGQFIVDIDMPILDPEVSDDVAYEEIMSIIG